VFSGESIGHRSAVDSHHVAFLPVVNDGVIGLYLDESRVDAVHRVADEELGDPVVIEECLGTYEHFYETSEIKGVDSKHYLATAYRCHFESDNPNIGGDDQHSALEVFHPPFDEYHPYVERYLDEFE